MRDELADPAYKTKSFWAVVAITLLGLLMGSGAIAVEGPIWRVLSLFAAALSAGGYTWHLKRGQAMTKIR